MAEGDIGAVVASLEFDDSNGVCPKIIHIAGNVYAIVYSGVDADGWIKTVTISNAGALALVAGGTLEFDEADCTYPDIIHVAGDVYAIVYTGVLTAGQVKTVTISDAGALALVAGGTLEFDAVQGAIPTIVQVYNSVYAIAYCGDTNHGWIKTVTISAAGAIALVAAGSLEFDAVEGFHPNIIRVTDNMFAVAYQKTGYFGEIKTVTISDAGALALVAGGTLTFSIGECHFPDIVNVFEKVYAIAFKGDANDGWITTVTISDAGALALVAGGSLEFDAADGWDPDLVHVSGTVYAVAYKGVLYDGWLKTLTISNAGAMALTGSSLEFDVLDCSYPDIIHVFGDMFVIAYTGVNLDGWLVTVPIERVVAAIKHLMMMGMG